MNATAPDLLKHDRFISIGNLIPNHCTPKFRNKIHERRVPLHRKGQMPRATSRGNNQGLMILDRPLNIIDAVDPDEVGAQVWHENEAPCRVEDSLVRMRSFLASWVRAWLWEGVVEGLDWSEEVGICNVPG